MNRDRLTTAQLMDSVRTTLTRGAEAVQQGFRRADADWNPILMVAHRDGGIDMREPLLDSAEAADRWFEDEYPQWVRGIDGHVVGHLFPTWTASPEELARGQRPSEYAGRREALVLILVAPREHEVWWAEIDRHADAPPTLREWVVKPGGVAPELTERLRRGIGGGIKASIIRRGSGHLRASTHSWDKRRDADPGGS